MADSEIRTQLQNLDSAFMRETAVNEYMDEWMCVEGLSVRTNAWRI